MTTAQEYLDRRWTALILLCVAQFIVVLDASIVNVALPSIGPLDANGDGGLLGHCLGLCDGGHWVGTSFTRLFGMCRSSRCKRNLSSV